MVHDACAVLASRRTSQYRVVLSCLHNDQQLEGPQQKIAPSLRWTVKARKMIVSCGFSLSSNDHDSVWVVPAVLTAARCPPPVALLSLLFALVPVASRDHQMQSSIEMRRQKRANVRQGNAPFLLLNWCDDSAQEKCALRQHLTNNAFTLFRLVLPPLQLRCHLWVELVTSLPLRPVVLEVRIYRPRCHHENLACFQQEDLLKLATSKR